MTWKIRSPAPINPVFLAHRDAHLPEFACVCILTSAVGDQHDRDQTVHNVGGSRCRGPGTWSEVGSSWQDKHKSGDLGALMTPPYPAGHWKPSPLAPRTVWEKPNSGRSF